MDMTPQRWHATSEYLRTVFGNPGKDHALASLSDQPARAEAAGLPPIAISADVGRLLSVLTVLTTRTPDSKGVVLEIGTLGGYSGIWIARSLPESGRLITLELDPAHAAFAQNEFERAGLARKARIVQGPALREIPRLAETLGPASVDLAFLDADKREYPEYARLIKPMIRVGGLLVADNSLGSSRWWITDAPDPADNEAAQSQVAADRFNRSTAADPDFETCCVPIREGVLIAVRTR